MKVLYPIALCLITLIINSHADELKTFQYSIMIDAGSSGSRVHIYTYPKNISSEDPSIFEAPLEREFKEKPWSLKITPGISAYYSDLEGIPLYLDTLMDYVDEHIDGGERGSSPVYFFATAGMRHIPEHESKAIMDVVDMYFRSSEYLFEDNWARIITGGEEAVFGWISVNHLFSKFGNLIYDTYGALDMGGASTQITFEPQYIPAEHGFNFTLGNRIYKLYDYSFLGYGLDLAEQQKTKYLIEQTGGRLLVDGCLPLGFSKIVKYNHTSYTIKGGSNAETCYKSAKAILNLKNCQQCSIDGTYQPYLHGKFVAFSGYTYTANFLGLPSELSPNAYYRAGSDFCSLTEQELEDKWAGTGYWNFIHSYCFNSMYITTLLKDAYGFPGDMNTITTAQKINNVEVGWTMGATLYEIIKRLPNTNNTFTSQNFSHSNENTWSKGKLPQAINLH